jgi:hypothetical protein
MSSLGMGGKMLSRATARPAPGAPSVSINHTTQSLTTGPPRKRQDGAATAAGRGRRASVEVTRTGTRLVAVAHPTTAMTYEEKR